MDDYRMSAEDKKKENTSRIRGVLIAVALTLAAGAAVFFVWRRFGAEKIVESPPPAPPSSVSAEELPVESAGEKLAYEVGTLPVTPERLAYNDGDMTLSIPKINFEGPVFSMDNPDVVGEDAVNAVLDNGVGLFYCAQMPGTGNANTSIAGHRDINGSEFYYLDQITDGDLIYLEWQGRRFTYEYAYTSISDDFYDWTPIMAQPESILTLQTCTPIGIASHRMFVVSKLIKTEELGGSSDTADSSQE